jgi:hypothetical protein
VVIRHRALRYSSHILCLDGTALEQPVPWAAVANLIGRTERQTFHTSTRVKATRQSQMFLIHQYTMYFTSAPEFFGAILSPTRDVNRRVKEGEQMEKIAKT